MDAWNEKCEQENRVFDSKILSFQGWLQYEMEDRISKMPDLGFDEVEPERIRVAVIQLDCDDGEVINLLKDRGEAIKYQKWDKQKKIEAKIEELKARDLERLITPCSVFMTFETEEGITRALSLNDMIKTQKEYSYLMLWLGKY